MSVNDLVQTFIFLRVALASVDQSLKLCQEGVVFGLRVAHRFA